MSSRPNRLLTPSRPIARTLFASLMLAVPGASLSTDIGHAQGRPGTAHHERHGVGVPSARQFVLCHGHMCRFKSAVGISEADRRRFHAIMAPGRASAKAERAAIARAVAWAEQRYGAQIGTRGDRAKTGYTDGGDPSQLDCVDESLNTTSVLLYLDGQGLLRHHRVGTITSRGYFVDMRYPHQTAVIVTQDGAQWAVDSWTKPSGALPDVLPLSVWSGQGGLRGS